MDITENCYESEDIKLAALILAEIPGSSYRVISQKSSSRKKIQIFFPNDCQSDVLNLINNYEMRVAKVDLFMYNKKLNWLRDSIRGGKV